MWNTSCLSLRGFFSRPVLPLLGLAILLFSSCTGLRKIPEEEVLYAGSRIRIEQQEDFRDDRKVKNELTRVLRPVPNSTFLFSRPRMWMYQVAGEPRGRGLRHIMRNRLGEEPVLFDDAYAERNMRLLNNRLYNMGYFDATVRHSLDSARRTVAVEYHILANRPYRFGEVHGADQDTPLARAVNASMKNTLLVPGEPYSLELLRRERRRIDRKLKEQGYFYFHPDHLLFTADSTAGDRTVNIHTRIKRDIPAAAGRKYRIGNIYIHADYMAAPLRANRDADTLRFAEGVYFTDALDQFDPATIARAIFFKKDSLYHVADHDRTLNHLMSLGTFQFVNLRFLPVERGEDEHFLDVRVLLAPMERRSITTEVRGVTKSNHFAGPGINAAYTNHNLLRGAESLSLRLSGAYETLVGRQRSASAYEFGFDASLSLPRFLMPGRLGADARVLSPKTTVSTGANYLYRTDAFSLTTLQVQYGYTWFRGQSTQFRVSPVVFNMFVLGNVEADIGELLADGTLLRRGLFEQFILGGQYSVIHNTRLRGDGNSDFFVQFNVDLSGNLAYLLMDMVLGLSPGDGGSHGLFNQDFAQYARSDVDFRYYRQLGEGRRLATRFFAGAGIPYGNSEMMPYVKQYVIGGSNSVRAFHPRSLGPGTYAPSEEQAGTYNIYQTGELKLEASVEYRFDITSLFKGAFFVDAGNIWRLREDENVPGGRFSTSDFYREIGMGAGTGLRIDPGFFILRFDFAVPLANPAINGDSFFDPVRITDRRWRRDNLVFSLAIGYPF